MASNDAVAPFVMKTYQMVNDSSSDNLIRWGNSGNTFIVIDTLHFSRSLLPAFFRHNNFSSFIRQLNTYGFKKVDPDRCEFANEWFLRGQMHLLKNIGRKRQSNVSKSFTMHLSCEDDEAEMTMEIARLKQEQKELEIEMLDMNKRIDSVERRPKQITALLCLVAEDPQILPRMMFKTKQKRLVEKTSRRMLQTSPASSSEMEINEMSTNEGLIVQSIPDSAVVWWRSVTGDTPAVWFPTATGGGGGGIGFDVGSGPEDLDVRPPPYPLLGGGF